MYKCNERFLACLFVRRVNNKSQMHCINELNNVFLSGSDQCPKSVDTVMTTCHTTWRTKIRGKGLEKGFSQCRRRPLNAGCVMREVTRQANVQIVRRKNNQRVDSKQSM